MPKTFDNPNPGLSILEDAPTLRQIANQARHALDMVDALKTAPPLSKEQWEREEFQARSNVLPSEAGRPCRRGWRGSPASSEPSRRGRA
jgi:hypothetical protein